MKISAFLLLSISISFISCSNVEREAIKFCLSNPEMLSYIETFNAIQNKYKIEVFYDSSPPDSLNDRAKNPDIVMSEWLASPAVMRKLESLEKMIQMKEIKLDLFYPQSINACSFDNEKRLLPVSFSLPAVVFRKDSINGIVSDQKILSIDELKKISLKYNELRNEKYVKMGFYPFWNKDFLYLTSELFNTNFTADTNKLVTWNKDALNESCSFLHEWFKGYQVGTDVADEFSINYFNKPFYQLVIEGEIFCYLSDSKAFYKIPEEKRKVLEFRWLSRQSKIPVNDNIVYIGISRKSQHKEGARMFLRWLFLPETQIKLLEINHFKRREGVYGIAGGFSPLLDITMNYIPQHSPLLSGYIPPAEELIFPGILSDKWKNFKSEILFPWMVEYSVAGTNEKKLEELSHFFK
jgi:ABC-type glycerol-3-phosphate transport system substrate-binding protein